MESAGSRGWHWWLLLGCFLLSGAAGLVYQVAWTRQFALVFGSSEQAVAAVLAAFLGGLGAGAAVAAKLAARISRPVRVYALLELAVALTALVVPAAIAAAERLYVGFFGHQSDLPASGELTTVVFDLATAFAVLAVPTLCMGATLPLLAGYAVRRQSEIGPATGMLYAMNTAGAVVGSWAAGFVLLPSFGLHGTIVAGVALNLLACGLALVVSRALPVDRSTAERHEDQARADVEAETDFEKQQRRHRLLITLVVISGAVSLTYEVFWTRLLSHLLGGSLYAFSTMLATFLAGIAAGSALAGRWARDAARGAFGFAVAQVGIAVFTTLSFLAVSHLPRWAAFAGVQDRSPTTDALLAAMALLPSAICIGATFPFAVRILARHASEASVASARVYGWSTVGSIVGAIATGLWLLPTLGFAATLVVALVVNLMLALLAATRLGSHHSWPAGMAAVSLVVLALFPPSTPWAVLRSGPLDRQPVSGRIIHHAVGRNATVLLTEAGDSWRLASNGLPEGSIQPPGAPLGRYQVTRWLGALPALLRPDSRSMMVVGLGAGEVLESIPTTVASIDVVELEPRVVAANRVVASVRRHDPLADPRVRLVINDARGALLLSDRTFGAIVSQPSHPWTSGSAHLYTQEFFELVRDHLEPGGVFVQWIGLAFVDGDLLRSLVATLGEVFPEVVVFRPPTGAALLFAASDRPLDLFGESARSLAVAAERPELGITRIEDLAAAWVLAADGARAFAAEAPVIHDDRNLLEARSPRVLGRALGRDLGESVLAPWDPLTESGGVGSEIDPLYLVRRLLDIGHGARARRLAEAITDPTGRQIALAWVATAMGDVRVASNLAADAVRRDPRSPEARALWLRSFRPRLLRGRAPDPRLLPLSPIESAVVAAWGHQSRAEWEALTELDATLARVVPGEPLFREALRSRVAWRIASEDRDLGHEAVVMTDLALSRGRAVEDLLLRARAAFVASDPSAVLSSLADLASLLARRPRRAVWAQSALTLLNALPEDPSSAEWRESVRSSLATLAGGGIGETEKMTNQDSAEIR